MERFHRKLETTDEIYQKLTFNTDDLFNKPAPDPIVSFAIGGVSRVFLQFALYDHHK